MTSDYNGIQNGMMSGEQYQNTPERNSGQNADQGEGLDSVVIKDVRIINKMGLHARPAMQFVDQANKFTSRITVSKNNQSVNAKSIMELLLLAASNGTILTIRAEGSDAQRAVDALATLVEAKFGEE
jgi:phosphocarrier protein